MSILTTDLNIGSITITGAVKTTGTTPNAGQIAIDTSGAKLIRYGTVGDIVLPTHFDDSDLITIDFGTSIIPSGASIISITDNGTEVSDGGVEVQVVDSNSISIERSASISGITDIYLEIKVLGYDDISPLVSSTSPFELANEEISQDFYASDALVDLKFTGIQRNDDRSLVEFWFTSMFLTASTYSVNFVRVLNGTNTNLTVTVPIGDITFDADGIGRFTVTSGISNIGLTEIVFAIREDKANLGSGLSIGQTKLDSQHIFKDEIELSLNKDIAALPTEIMGGLDDVSGFNLKDIFTSFEFTSEFNEMPVGNYVRVNTFNLSRTANTFYATFRVFDESDLLIREIAGSANMTVSGITDWSNVSLDYTLDGYRVRYTADLTSITSNTVLSLTKENARFKIPAKNIRSRNTVFNKTYNTLGNTVNKQYFDVSRFIEDIRIVPKSKEFALSNGSLKEAKLNYFEVSATRYYISFEVGGIQYTGSEEPRNNNIGHFDVTFSYTDVDFIVRAEWNNISSYIYNYDTAPVTSAVFTDKLMIDAYTEGTIQENSAGLSFNDKAQFILSTDKVSSYLYKDVDWGQSTKIPRTNFIAIPDHNDETAAMSTIMSWLESDSAIEKAIPCVLLQGDFITAVETDVSSFTTKVTDYLASIPNDIPILWCNGNHDLGLDGSPALIDVPTAAQRKALIHDPLYDRLPQDYKDNIVRGTATDAMYYYCDVPDTNVRVISIDQFEYPLIADVDRPIKYSGTAIRDVSSNIIAGFNVYYSEDQLNFIVNALNTIPAGGTALIMVHIPIDSGSDASGELNALGNSNIVLRSILSNYKNRVDGNVSVDAIDEIAGFTIAANFSTRVDSKGLIINGHLHNFYHSKLEGGSDMNAIQNMSAGNVSPYISIDGDSITKYGADILSLNEDLNELYVLRYGSRKTIGASGNNIGVGEYGFNFVKKPLTL